jgi:hypothetical protein
MNKYDEIKSIVEATRKVFGKNTLDEVTQIRRSHGLLLEQPEVENKQPEVENKQPEIEKPRMFGEERPKDEEKRTFKIQGSTISIHGKSKADLQLTLDEKVAFKESTEEFRSEVAELVDFNTLNVYDNNVEWSGVITDRDIEFYFSVSESNGVYINGQMIQLEPETMELFEKMQKFYDKFKLKWSKIIASRKETEK